MEGLIAAVADQHSAERVNALLADSRGNVAWAALPLPDVLATVPHLYNLLRDLLGANYHPLIALPRWYMTLPA